MGLASRDLGDNRNATHFGYLGVCPPVKTDGFSAVGGAPARKNFKARYASPLLTTGHSPVRRKIGHGKTEKNAARFVDKSDGTRQETKKARSVKNEL